MEEIVYALNQQDKCMLVLVVVDGEGGRGLYCTSGPSPKRPMSVSPASAMTRARRWQSVGCRPAFVEALEADPFCRGQFSLA